MKGSGCGRRRLAFLQKISLLSVARGRGLVVFM